MIIIPSMTNFGDSPKGLRNTRARFTYRCYFVAAIAKKKPPKKIIMIGEVNVVNISLKGSHLPMSSISLRSLNQTCPLLKINHNSSPINKIEVAMIGISSSTKQRTARIKMASILTCATSTSSST